MQIFIGNLPAKLTQKELERLFAYYGQISSARVLGDKFSGRSRGFGFVEMPNVNEAQNAINSINGMEFMGQKLIVEQSLNLSHGASS